MKTSKLDASTPHTLVVLSKTWGEQQWSSLVGREKRKYGVEEKREIRLSEKEKGENEMLFRKMRGKN